MYIFTEYTHTHTHIYIYIYIYPLCAYEHSPYKLTSKRIQVWNNLDDEKISFLGELYL